MQGNDHSRNWKGNDLQKDVEFSRMFTLQGNDLQNGFLLRQDPLLNMQTTSTNLCNFYDEANYFYAPFQWPYWFTRWYVVNTSKLQYHQSILSFEWLIDSYCDGIVWHDIVILSYSSISQSGWYENYITWSRIDSHMLHVEYLPRFTLKISQCCRQIYHTWSIWVIFLIIINVM